MSGCCRNAGHEHHSKVRLRVVGQRDKKSLALKI
jgi:hypothetical protein